MLQLQDRIPDRIAAANEMSADLGRIHSWGWKWNINFEPTKCHALCVSLKNDVGLHQPVFMDTLSIVEVDVLKVLEIYFDRKLTWSYIIDQLATWSRQQLDAVYRVREYLGQSGLTIAFKSFVRPICEYGNIIFMGASATHLHKLDLIQKIAERLCGTTFLSLASRRIGLLCKLLDLWCRGPLQNFCPILTSVTHAYSFRHVMDDCCSSG